MGDTYIYTSNTDIRVAGGFGALVRIVGVLMSSVPNALVDVAN